MATTENKACRHCGAIITAGMMQNHLAWHRTLEPQLEEPTSEFGFWDFDGRWNRNSRDW